MRIVLGDDVAATVAKYAPRFFGADGVGAELVLDLGEESKVEAKLVFCGQYLVRCVDHGLVYDCMVASDCEPSGSDWFEVWDRVVGGGLTASAVAGDPAFDGFSLEVG